MNACMGILYSVYAEVVTFKCQLVWELELIHKSDLIFYLVKERDIRTQTIRCNVIAISTIVWPHDADECH